ncbi:unknown protein [Desulfotalea psychrophila LSv54]|uniref:Uncharacterized protein n=1 Tax=Desulfotalea psychrophila (strain LSv54 / DSM 12343) TaxID=177439 RepID=Q6ALD5_DESPS|nr:unknown protein [Desulfotalea psychrophila LSv54]
MHQKKWHGLFPGSTFLPFGNYRSLSDCLAGSISVWIGVAIIFFLSELYQQLHPLYLCNPLGASIFSSVWLVF